MNARRGFVRSSTLAGAVPCALATHAAVYRSFWPSDGVHRYFGWYEPAVGAASVASVIALFGFLAVARAARSYGRPLRLRASAPVSLASRARSLGSCAVVLLLVQETLERSVPAGHVVPASFLPSQWLTVLFGAAAAAFVLALGVRLAESAVRSVLRPPASLGKAPVSSPAWSVVVRRPVRLRPLAEGFGLRAPPIFPV